MFEIRRGMPEDAEKIIKYLKSRENNGIIK